MTVEEIVARIKAGETDLLPMLWERVEATAQLTVWILMICARKDFLRCWTL